MRVESLKAFCKFLIIISFYCCYYYLFSRSFGKCCERLIMAESGDANAKTGEISDLENRIIRQVEVRITKRNIKCIIKKVSYYNISAVLLFTFFNTLFMLDS